MINQIKLRLVFYMVSFTIFGTMWNTWVALRNHYKHEDVAYVLAVEQHMDGSRLRSRSKIVKDFADKMDLIIDNQKDINYFLRLQSSFIGYNRRAIREQHDLRLKELERMSKRLATVEKEINYLKRRIEYTVKED